MRDPASITTNCTLNVPLDTLSENLFRKKTRQSDMDEYWELRYNIVLQIQGGNITILVEIDGEEFGKVTVRQ